MSTHTHTHSTRTNPVFSWRLVKNKSIGNEFHNHAPCGALHSLLGRGQSRDRVLAGLRQTLRLGLFQRGALGGANHLIHEREKMQGGYE